ncbi:MAG: hypothetical protein ACK5JB_03250 [Pseudanabaena sp.]|jgi:hypothetical protein
MGEKVVKVSIESSIIEVSGSLYPVNQISGVKVVAVKKSAWEFLSGGRRYAILLKMQGENYSLLVVSRDERSVNNIFSRIKEAIASQAQGNFSYVNSVTLNGDITNQSGNFGVGFNSGVVDLG